MGQHIKRLISDIKAFVLSSALVTALDFDLFRLLEAESLSRDQLRSAVGIKGAVSDAFLDVLIANGYLSETNGRIGLTPVSQEVLPDLGELRSWAKEMELTLQSVGDLAEVLRSGDASATPLSRFWGYKSAAEPTTTSEAYSKVMDESGEALYRLLSSAWDFNRYRRVIDLGGGFGGLATHLASVTEDTEFVCADLSPVLGKIDDLRGPEGPSPRVKGLRLDFLKDAVPENFDGFILCRVIHDWDDESVLQIFKNVRQAMDNGSELIIVENLGPSRQEEPDPSSAASAMMLALMGGKRRSREDIEELLHAIGMDVHEFVMLGKSRLAAVVAVPV